MTQLAKYAGAEVIATAGARSAEAVWRQGADQVIDYTATSVVAATIWRRWWNSSTRVWSSSTSASHAHWPTSREGHHRPLSRRRPDLVFSLHAHFPLGIYGYTTGVRSSRTIECKCADDIAFRYLAADQAPDFRSISRFRRRHLDALADLFAQSLHLAARLGMVKMGRIALDGTKLEANASKHKAMSYGRLVDKEEKIEAETAALEAQADALLADAEATDTAEDQRFGVEGKDTDLPAELDRREKRLAKLQAARAQIEVEAAGKARRHAEDKERRRQKRVGTGDEQAVTDASDTARRVARCRGWGTTPGSVRPAAG